VYEHVKQRWYRVHKDPNECTHFEASHVHACHPIFGLCVVAGVDQARALPSKIVVKVVLEGIGELLANSVTFGAIILGKMFKSRRLISRS